MIIHKARFLPRVLLIRVVIVLLVLTLLLAAGVFSFPHGNTRVEAASPFVEPPSNDNLARAQPILGASGIIHGTNVDATKEDLEANHAGNSGGASVWYRWQAPFSGRFTFTTFDPDESLQLDSVLAVYTGFTFPLLPIVSNDNDPLIDSSTSGLFSVPACGNNRFSSSVSFDAVGGVFYLIAVDRSATAETGRIILRWGRSVTISGSVTTAGGTLIGADEIRLIGDTCQRGGSNFRYQVPTGGSYQVVVRNPTRPSDNFARWGTTQSISPLTGDVTDFNFFQSSPTGNISGIVSTPTADKSGLTVMCAAHPTPLFSKAADVLSDGSYTCSSLPQGTEYNVVPAKPGLNFEPPNRIVFILSPNSNATQINFLGSQAPTRIISGRITQPNGTTGVSGVSVALSGTQTTSSVTDANGNFSFTGILQGGNYTVTPSSANFTFSPTSRTFNNVGDQTAANFTATFVLQLVLDDLGQVAALDSVLLMRDPFPVINSANLLNPGVDRNTRVAIFLSNFQLGPTESPSSVVINLVGSNSQSFDIPAEDVRPLSDGFTRVTFRLPDTLTVGTCTILVKAHGLTSNLGALTIRN